MVKSLPGTSWPSIYEWLFQLDDEPILYIGNGWKSPFPSTLKWLFRVPGKSLTIEHRDIPLPCQFTKGYIIVHPSSDIMNRNSLLYNMEMNGLPLASLGSCSELFLFYAVATFDSGNLAPIYTLVLQTYPNTL